MVHLVVMSSSDPFNESVKELRDLIFKAKILQQQSVQKGIVTAACVEELQTITSESDEIVAMLKEMMRAVSERGGRVQGKIFSANEVMERQSLVRELESEAADLREFYKKVYASNVQRQRTLDIQAAAAASGGDPRGVFSDEFITSQVHAQREEEKVQDVALDRLTVGLQELRETGVNIHGELNTQEEMLDHLDRDLSGVQVRLRAANEKVDKLLASMSNRGKVCTIVILIFILVFLAFFGFS